MTGGARAFGVRLRSLSSERARAGTPIDLGGRVIALSFEESTRKAAKARLEFDNHDLSLFDRAELAGGALWELAWGYTDAMAPPRRLVVRKLTGFETLVLEAHGVAVLLDRHVRTRTFHHVSRAQVARLIAREHGYDDPFLHVDDEGPLLDTIVQAGETDARLLRRLAVAEGRQFFVDRSGLHFHRPRGTDGPVRVLSWRDPARGDVLSIHIESNLAQRVGRVEARGRDLLSKRDVTAAPTKDSTPRPVLAPSVEVVEPVHAETGASAVTVRTSTIEVGALPPVPAIATEAQARARARFTQAEAPSVKLSMQVVGDPALAPDQVVEVRGIGPRFSGLFRVFEVKHQVSASGYLCDLNLRRDGVSTRTRDRGGTRHGQTQGGDPVPRTGPAPGALGERRLVDPETGRELTLYVPTPFPLGAHDPEGRPR
jgi:uncharacterized protein